MVSEPFEEERKHTEYHSRTQYQPVPNEENNCPGHKGH